MVRSWTRSAQLTSYWYARPSGAPVLGTTHTNQELKLLLRHLRAGHHTPLAEGRYTCADPEARQNARVRVIPSQRRGKVPVPVVSTHHEHRNRHSKGVHASETLSE